MSFIDSLPAQLRNVLTPKDSAAIQRAFSSIPSSPLWVAYSGGLDSSVLLHLSCYWCRYHQQALPRAVHVHHGLSPSADEWLQHCLDQSALLGVTLVGRRVALSLSGKGIENAAREARYTVFEEVLDQGEVLLQAHHLGDQAETLLLRLLRGAGIEGLAAMPVQRSLGKGSLYRPLLGISRALILRIGQALGLTWIHDESNDAVDFDRNYLRHEVLPKLAERWPAAEARFAATARHCGEVAMLMDDLARRDFCTVSLSEHAMALSLEALTQLPAGRQKGVLRYWFRRLEVPVPGEKVFAAIQSDLIAAREDANPEVRWGDVVLQRSRQQLHLARKALPDAATRVRSSAIVSFDPYIDEHVYWMGRAWKVIRKGAGQCLPGVWLRYPQPNESASLRLRGGGETIRQAGDMHHRTLKYLFQHHAIPVWEREGLPLVFIGEQLVGVADRFVAAEAAVSASEAGWRLSAVFDI
ncbi:MAG: tRNA lysidine(34) synthetase TilS [Hahellaceae bacterium]|nr:tRNA lysidine(34) synthetase TilS [Hahellaceae bacterium]